MSTLIPTTPAANKSTEPHQEPSEQDSFNHLLYKVLRLTSQQVQDLNGWMEYHGIPNVHEVIAQNYHKPHTLEDKLKFITQGKPCYIQFNVMLSLSLVITYIRHRRYSTKSKYFGPFYYIQIDPQHYDEWRITPPEEEIHFSWPNDEDEYQNLFSDDNQVIQQENSCSEPPEPLSYSVFQSHFQGSSTSSTQKILLPKPTWEKPSKDQQQMIIDHNLNSGSPHLSTPNKSPSSFSSTTTNQCLASPSGEGTTLPFSIPYPQQSKNSLPLDPFDESTPTFEQFVNSQSGEDEDNPIHMVNIDIPNLLGRSFLLPPEDNGEHHMAKIIDIDDHGQSLEDIKFKLKINKDQGEEIMSYNQLMDYIQKGTDAEEDPDSLFKFRDIIAHQGPLESTDPNHKGSKKMLSLNGSLGRSLMNL